MNRVSKLGFLLSVMLCTSTLMASLYGWNWKHRPPVSLTDAITLAQKALGDEAPKSYCVSASLYGNKKGDGKEGAWNLLYATDDGSCKKVHIDMQGQISVGFWSGPDNEKLEGQLKDLAELKPRLEALLQVYKIPAQVVLDQDVLRVEYLTRDYLVYQKNEQGEYAAEQVTERGPKAEGIWLEVRLTKETEQRETYPGYPPYWSHEGGTYLTIKPKIYFAVDLRFGSKVLPALVLDFRKVFGPELR